MIIWELIEVTVGDDIFKLDEFIDPYQVASSINLEENSKFCIAENTFIDVDVKDLNDILRTNGHTWVNEDDDNNKINVENYDGDNDDEIDEE